jgi:serine/threonine protein kinase
MIVSCLEPKTLRRYLNGKTSKAETERVEGHLADCLKCQVSLESLSEEPNSIMKLVAEAVREPVDSERPLRPNARAESAQSGANATSDMIRDYRILECVGQGGMGSVYRALHVRLNRQVAVKILKSERMESSEAISRFAREMRVLAQLEHRHIVRALDAGEQDGIPYFVMEFVSGINLSQLVRRLGPLPVPEACSIARLAASALQYAHEQKVIHRDVKPSNLMITAEGEVKLLDLGLAQILELKVEDSLSRADQVLGTLAYMSPEQLSGRQQVTRQSDIYSLGVTLHELLTGQRPSEQPNMQPLVSNIRGVRPDVDEDLNALVGDMIAFTPSERPISMTEVESRLNAIAPSVSLTSLVVEYYRWDNRSLGTSKPQLAKVDTEAFVVRPPIAPDFKDARRDRSATKWIIGLAIAGAFAALSWMAFRPDPFMLPAVDKTQGKILVAADDDIGAQFLSEGSVYLQRVDTQDRKERYNVHEGMMDLPLGTYQVIYDGPDDFKQDGADLEVFATATTKLTLKPIAIKLFQYPEIPDTERANATYHGALWRSGWEMGDQKLPFTIYLEVLSVDSKPNFPVTKWLKIEVTSKGEEEHCETAFLNIDAKKWETQRLLDVREGWIVANSPAIEKYLSGLRSNPGRETELVVRFDRKHDLIGEMQSVPLPSQRLSIQDVLSLFFGQEMPSAGGAINKVRSMLPSIGSRQAWLELVPDARGPVQCYVVSSRNKGDDESKQGFMMARRRGGPFNPFGFVKLQATFPGLVEAVCEMKNTGVADLEVGQLELRGQLERRIESIRQNVLVPKTSVLSVVERDPPSGNRDFKPYFQPSWLSGLAFTAGENLASVGRSIFNSKTIPDLPESERNRPSEDRDSRFSSSTKRFDLAPVPNSPSSQTFTGGISLNKNHKESITATIRMLGEENLDGRSFRWIDIDVATHNQESDHLEFARVLVDADAYSNFGDFSIKQGWIAYGNRDFAFAIPSDLNLEALVDFRLQLQQKPEWNRIGVVDVMSMLFNAKLKPRTSISTLREVFAEIAPGLSRNVTPESVPHKSGEQLDCERWEPNRSTPQLNYSFLRSSQVPFGFVAVTLNRGDLSIGLEMVNHRSLSKEDLSQSAFGSKAQLSVLLANTQERLQPVPNWRVWTWTDARKTYKAWAEFGGTIDTRGGTDVLLRYNNDEIRIPKVSLSDADKISLQKGRLWSKKSFADGLWRVLEKDDEIRKSVQFWIPERSIPHLLSGDPLDPDDRTWLERLRAATKAKPDRLRSEEAWRAFAGHVK